MMIIPKSFVEHLPHSMGNKAIFHSLLMRPGNTDINHLRVYPVDSNMKPLLAMKTPEQE